MNTISEVSHSPAELARLQLGVDRLLIAEGAGHIVHDLPVRADGRTVGIESRPWRLDPIPYVVSADEYSWIERAITERLGMLEALLTDLYGDRAAVADGLVDPAALWGSSHYRLAAVGASDRREQRRWLSTYAVDLVRAVDGEWYVIADHTDSPVGLGYSLLDRNVMTQVVDVGATPPRPFDSSLELTRRALVDSTTSTGPRVVMLTSGIDHPAYVEHSYMATQLGFNVVEGPDLVVRDRQLWLQTLGGLDRIDVLYRRIGDRQLDPLETNTYGSAGIPAVLLATDSGTLSIVNAHGTGLLEDPNLFVEFERAGAALLGRSPMLALRSPKNAPGATAVDALLGKPAERVACYVDGGLVEQPIVLRFHAVATDAGIAVVPGGNGRVIEAFDDPTLPTPCRAKDIWVMGEAPPFDLGVTTQSAPQVDFITSVPTRAADSLYWLGRASERAEAVARSMRVFVATPPAVRWVELGSPTLQLLDALTGSEHAPDATSAPTWAEARHRAIAAAAESLEFHIGSMLAEAASVREFLSATAGRILGEMVETRDRLRTLPEDVDALDALLFQLSAFAGLWSESVVRGPAWYFGDFAKRYERCLVSLTSGATAVSLAQRTELAELDRRRGLEGVLAANDSLVAYRRRHRSDVEIEAVLNLLVHDERNPRSTAASIGGLLRNSAAIGWTTGTAQVEAIARDLERFRVGDRPEVLEGLAQRLHAVAAELTAARLTAPPHPTLVRPRLVDPGAVA